MAANVGNAVLTIVPKLQSGSLSGIESQVGSSGTNAGSIFSGKLKTAVVAGAAAAGAALAKTMFDAASAYADYEQLVGGVETLFEDSADVVQEYAANAYKTAGLSANQYMETATSFSASLLQSLGGDTAAAAKYADLAITDMSDNANKMGTAMESIQNAYQGFAKQNFTMLDNLKLGYSGSKSEMERLLQDAQAISGIQYDISSYADIVSAIHVIQTEIGITGTTALEAATTIEGSLNSLKGAWQNLLVGIASDDADIDGLVNNLTTSITAFANNIIPRVVQILQAMIPALVQLIPTLVSVVTQLASGIVQALPTIIINIVNAIIQNLPIIIQGIMTLITGIVQALPEIVAQLIEALPGIITLLGQSMIENAPILLGAAVQLFMAIPQAIFSIIGTCISNIGNILSAIWNAITGYIGNMAQAGLNLIKGLAQGIVNAKDWLVSKIKELCSNALDAIKGFFGINSPSRVMRDVVGKNLVLGIGEGIKQNIGYLNSVVDNTMSGVMDRASIPMSMSANINASGSTGNSMASAVQSLHNDLGNIISKYSPNAIGATNAYLTELSRKAVM